MNQSESGAVVCQLKPGMNLLTECESRLRMKEFALQQRCSDQAGAYTSCHGTIVLRNAKRSWYLKIWGRLCICSYLGLMIFTGNHNHVLSLKSWGSTWPRMSDHVVDVLACAMFLSVIIFCFLKYSCVSKEAMHDSLLDLLYVAFTWLRLMSLPPETAQ